MTNNYLLTRSLVALGAYTAASLSPASEYVSSVSSFILLTAAGACFLQYYRKAWGVVWRNERDEKEPGAHWSVYGAALASFGCIYVGIFGLIWVSAGMPPSWLNTPFSGFGRFVAGAGFLLLFLSPNVATRNLKFPTGVWVVSLLMVLALAAFFLGLRVGTYQGKMENQPDGYESTDDR